MPLFQKTVPCEQCGTPIPLRSFRLQRLRCPSCKRVADPGCLWAVLALPLGIAVGAAVAVVPGLLLPGNNFGRLPHLAGFLAGIDTVAIAALVGYYRARDDDLQSSSARLGRIAAFGLVALRVTRGLDLGWRGTLIIANAWIGLLVVPRVVDWIRRRDAAQLDLSTQSSRAISPVPAGSSESPPDQPGTETTDCFPAP